MLYPHPHDNWSWGASLTGAGLLGFLTALAVRQARPRPWLFVGWFWFVGTLFPVIGLAQERARRAWADRFSYWPHIGLFVALVWGTTEVVARVGLPAAVAGMLWSGALAGLMVLTSAQVRYWHDSVVLWEHVVAVTDNSLYTRERLSLAYRRQGRTAEADFHMREAKRLLYAHDQRERSAP